MDFSQVNWANVGFVVMGLCVIAFGVCAWRRQWSVGALIVGLVHLPIALTHAAAPFRGALDPTYPDYSMGLVFASKGVEVGIFSLAMLLGGLACACIIVLNRPGARNYFVTAFDAMLILLLLPSTLGGLMTRGLDAFRIEFGDYLQFGGLPAFLFEAALLLAVPIIGVFWSLKRARAD